MDIQAALDFVNDLIKTYTDQVATQTQDAANSQAFLTNLQSVLSLLQTMQKAGVPDLDSALALVKTYIPEVAQPAQVETTNP